ncbi:MAG: NAD(P)H-dependent oxidoreductase [Bacteroidetes bacterium]|nr:NAD(P)H-dependent oxidoreductase [Bacteroidota bacterium]
MKKILAFAGSNSSTSINHTLVSHVASTISDAEVSVIKLTDYDLPLYSIDVETEQGFPNDLKTLLATIAEVDAMIISVNEHNGTISAFFKNVLDWLTRLEYKFPANKKVLLLSTSPGKRGGVSALEYISGFLPRIDADIVGSIAFPSFSENFNSNEGTIVNTELSEAIEKAVTKLVS